MPIRQKIDINTPTCNIYFGTQSLYIRHIIKCPISYAPFYLNFFPYQF